MPMTHDQKPPHPRAAKDTLFQEERPLISDFNFGGDTAAVFDDMLDRSVPFYQEVQRMIGEMAQDFAVEGTGCFDLGCSTGNTLLRLDPLLPADMRFIGVDSSPEMLEKARTKFARVGMKRHCELVLADLNDGYPVSDASVVIMNLTLQFVRPLQRAQLMKFIADGIRPQGCLLLIEKVLSRDSTLNRLFIKRYYEYKERQGYSKMEIAQKREALENVLIPYRIEENRDLLLGAGFTFCDVFVKWYNFCGMIALK